MPQVKNARVLFSSIPEGYPIPGETTVYDTTQTIDLETVPLNGGISLKTLVLSIDPYFRVIMQNVEHPAAFKIGAPLSGFGIAVVLRSENPSVTAGQHVYGFNIAHQDTWSFPNWAAANHGEAPEPAMVGVLALLACQVCTIAFILFWMLLRLLCEGQTAYIGWKEFANAKAGEIAFVSAGAGECRRLVSLVIFVLPTTFRSMHHRMVIQLAKQAGLKVIASAGSEEKTTDTRGVLAKEGPIDIYWDNVGGDILDAALEFAAPHGRFLLCGAISGYNTVTKLHLINANALHVHGIVMAHLPVMQYLPEFYATIPGKLANGELKYAEEVTRGLDKVGEVILAVQRGTNKAKAIVLVAEESE
ncbi:NAD(P)-binding protein [Mycena leptocephala]|nr:NAD(P)-binding protein [Mycena leptocephala]